MTIDKRELFRLSVAGLTTLVATGLGSYHGANVVASKNKRDRDKAEKDRQRDAVNEVLLGLLQRARTVWAIYGSWVEQYYKLITLLEGSQYDERSYMFVPPFKITAYESVSLKLENLDWFIADDNDKIVERIGIELHNYYMLLEVNKIRDGLFEEILSNPNDQHSSDLLRALAQLNLLNLRKLLDRKSLASAKDLKALIAGSFNDDIDDFVEEDARDHLPRIKEFIEGVQVSAPQTAWHEYMINSEQYMYRVFGAVGLDFRIYSLEVLLSKADEKQPVLAGLFDELRKALDSKYGDLMTRPRLEFTAGS